MIALFVCAILLSGAGVSATLHSPGPAGAVTPAGAPSFAPGEVLLRFSDGTSPAARARLLEDAGASRVLKQIGPVGDRHTLLVGLRPGATVEGAVGCLSSRPEVSFAEPNYLRSLMYVPDDPGFGNQWGLRNTGQTIGGSPGVPGADIDAVNAWDIEDGTSNPVVAAVLDSGINFFHPDLDARIWVNSDEIPGNHLDDDSNGYVDDVNGYNWAGISQTMFYYFSGGTPVFMSRPLGNGPSMMRYAQSFTGTGQDLTHAGILVDRVGDPPAGLTVSVRSSLSGADLCSYTVQPSEVGTFLYELYRPLSSTVALGSGTTYYLVIDTAGQDAANYYNIYESRGAVNGNVYAEGQEYSWDGGAWQSSAQDDFYFQTNPNPYPRDDNGHGTYVSGILGAEDNSEGIVGVSRGVSIMPLKVMDASGVPSAALNTDEVCDALYYAADNGADVVSMSLGNYMSSEAEQDAVDYAHGQGLVLVAAAGNDGDGTMLYPAGCEHVIGAGATTNQDQKASFSNFNSSVDATAPGKDVYSTSSSGGYGFGSGTSAATPHIAGLAALVFSLKPSYSADQVELAIEDNAEDLGDPGRDDYFGHGRIDAFRTLQVVTIPPHVDSMTSPAMTGATVTITGTSFGTERGGSLVSFSGADASVYTSWTGTEITCDVPPGALSGPVTVTTDNGTSNGVDFVLEYPAPTVASITPSSGENDGTVQVTDLAGTGFREGASVKLTRSGHGDIDASDVDVVSSMSINCSLDLTGGAAGYWNLTVGNSDGKSATRDSAFRIVDPEEPGPEPEKQHTWYLAEGTSDWGFDTFVTIQNPNDKSVTARVTFMTEDGPETMDDVPLPAGSQTVMNPRNVLGSADFSTMVVCLEGEAIAVDRRMTWRGDGAASTEGHCSVGVTGPDDTWYLAEGSSKWGFETWLLIQNPNEQEATCSVTYMIEGEDPTSFEKKVPASSRASFNMADDIGEKDASIKVTGDVPIIPERAMYRHNRREGHDSIGTTTPADSYFLAEGTSDWGFTTYVLVQNPNATEATVALTYMTPDGPLPQDPFTMPANSRWTVRVNDALPASDFSTRVDANKPIIAERAMYWDSGSGEACHDSVGMVAPHTTFFLPDGETFGGYETWTLVQNPNGDDVEVEVTYMTPSGEGNVSFDETVPANSRMTFDMADAGISGRAAVRVTSKTAGRKIMVERAMYWNNRGAGTDTIGAFAD
ncbi:MAG: S8 family serine peptidase [Actinomycetota bacterium]